MSKIRTNYFMQIVMAVNFIEANLTNYITLEEIANNAYYSKYHFIRIFSAVVGETVGDYVRKSRVSKSSKELINTDRSILSIAIQYQFTSQEAYTRSFKKVYQTTPGRYRKQGVNQIAFGRSKLSELRLNHLREKITLRPQIVEIDERKIVGINTQTSLMNDKISEMWNRFLKMESKIRNRIDTCYYELHPYDSDFGMNDFTNETQFEKWAAVPVVDFNNIPIGMSAYTLTKGKYAVFTHIGKMSEIQFSFDFVYGTWLPNSKYILDSRDDFERYDENYLGPNNQNSKVEIWIPIK